MSNQSLLFTFYTASSCHLGLFYLHSQFIYLRIARKFFDNPLGLYFRPHVAGDQYQNHDSGLRSPVKSVEGANGLLNRKYLISVYQSSLVAYNTKWHILNKIRWLQNDIPHHNKDILGS